ncbi:trans-Golgi network integral membrane protein TGN38 [Hyalella azteca]|uniref:Trans-Golgi network integral membrane protein TGN38 n=1 Tax=Hyalella azteca TaxID=294128 RepID=A0A8B7NT76_HYAAZ|nr:trans-Golgi network integral membrane protein TGN38 [Hyalella azteca]
MTVPVLLLVLLLSPQLPHVAVGDPLPMSIKELKQSLSNSNQLKTDTENKVDSIGHLRPESYADDTAQNFMNDLDDENKFTGQNLRNGISSVGDDPGVGNDPGVSDGQNTADRMKLLDGNSIEIVDDQNPLYDRDFPNSQIQNLQEEQMLQEKPDSSLVKSNKKFAEETFLNPAPRMNVVPLAASNDKADGIPVNPSIALQPQAANYSPLKSSLGLKNGNQEAVNIIPQFKETGMKLNTEGNSAVVAGSKAVEISEGKDKVDYEKNNLMNDSPIAKNSEDHVDEKSAEQSLLNDDQTKKEKSFLSSINMLSEAKMNVASRQLVGKSNETLPAAPNKSRSDEATKKSDPLQQIDSAKPLIDGAKPLIDGAKPLNDSVKPLNDGAKPLNENAKTNEAQMKTEGFSSFSASTYASSWGSTGQTSAISQSSSVGLKTPAPAKNPPKESLQAPGPSLGLDEDDGLEAGVNEDEYTSLEDKENENDFSTDGFGKDLYNSNKNVDKDLYDTDKADKAVHVEEVPGVQEFNVEGYSQNTTAEANSHFTYLVMLTIIAALGYVVYIKRNKILALLLEGRRGSGGSRRGSMSRRQRTRSTGSGYSLLRSTEHDTTPATQSNGSTEHTTLDRIY